MSTFKGKKVQEKHLFSIKALNLENNYCLYNEDKILIVNSDYLKTNICKTLYDEERNKDYFYSLFSLNRERIDILSIKELISTYSEAYKRENGLALRLISDLEGKNIFYSLKEEIDRLLESYKFYKKATMSYIFNEVLWIKASNFSKEDYLNVDRRGRGISIRKNSNIRELIYKILETYNSKLLSQNMMDKYDAVLFALHM